MTGNSTLEGGEGNDTLAGSAHGSSDDLLKGGSGNDQLWGSWGQDTLYEAKATTR